MAMISCPECGKQISDRASSCPNCGCPIGEPAAGAAPQTNTAEEVSKLLVLARRARVGADSLNAKKYYDQILDKDPGNWEAMFFSVYYTASECKIMNISSAAHSVANSIYGTFCAISDLSDEAEQVEALKTVIDAATGIAGMFASSAQSFFNQHSTVSTSRGECSNRMVASCSIYTEIEACLKKVFPDQKYVLADFQKTFIAFLNRHSAWLTTTACARLAGEIGAVYPEYGKRIQLEEEIKSLNKQINATSSPSAGGCIGGFFLIVGAIMFFLGMVLISLDSSQWWCLLVAGLELGLGLIITLAGRGGKPSKAEQNKQKQELIAKRDALQRELNNMK